MMQTRGGDRMIEIQLVKQLLILTPGELTSLLAPKPKLWQKALKRGNAAKTRVLHGTTNGEVTEKHD